MEQYLVSTAKWLSNNNLKLIEIIHTAKNYVIYKDIINDTYNIQTDSRNNFVKNYNPVTLDMSLYNGLPIKYMGIKINNSKFN
tara:strand:- start:53 stop:301 length:249 start_codon:yes stop_codon:yes gene_type:complete